MLKTFCVILFACMCTITFVGCSSEQKTATNTSIPQGLGPVDHSEGKAVQQPQGEDKKFFDAVRKDDSATVNTILNTSKKFLDIRDAKGLTPLMVAATYNKLKCAEALIKAGADLKATNESGRTALHAASTSGHLEMVKLLVTSGSDVNARSKALGTPLHAAAIGGSVEVCDFLLSKGASVNATTKRGVTPLIAALSKGGHKEIAKFLLDKGATFDPTKLSEAMTGKKLSKGAASGDKSCCEDL